MKPEMIKQYVEENQTLLLETLKELCAIPAPSGKEEKRAAYCKQWLENIGAKGVYIDDALNVIFPLNCEGSRDITVFVAHTDTVVPDLEPMPYVDDGEKIHCPGVGDDTASLVVMLCMAKYCVENDLRPAGGYLFVCNSCEEGLGNLKGTRQLMKDYGDRIVKWFAIDGGLDSYINKAVGSKRYEITIETEVPNLSVWGVGPEGIYVGKLPTKYEDGKLTFQYSLIWFVLGFGLMLCIIFPNILIDASHIVGVEVASNFVFLVEGIFVLVLLISLTLIVSKQRKQIVRLTQRMAILERRLRELEEKK